jgi:hypothetical protein
MYGDCATPRFQVPPGRDAHHIDSNRRQRFEVGDLRGELLRLYIGKRFTGITVVHDDGWPGMWRVRNRDHLSDMVNLARAKDAALCWARPRGLGGGKMVRWDSRETTCGARYFIRLGAGFCRLFTNVVSPSLGQLRPVIQIRPRV